MNKWTAGGSDVEFGRAVDNNNNDDDKMCVMDYPQTEKD